MELDEEDPLMDYLLQNAASNSQEMQAFVAWQPVAPATPPGAFRRLPGPCEVERLVLSYLAPGPGLVFL